jgi:hypothetical protein
VPSTARSDVIAYPSVTSCDDSHMAASHRKSCGSGAVALQDMLTRTHRCADLPATRELTSQRPRFDGIPRDWHLLRRPCRGQSAVSLGAVRLEQVPRRFVSGHAPTSLRGSSMHSPRRIDGLLTMATVNGQVSVPAGGQLKSPPLAEFQVVLSRVPPFARACFIR